jgi:hypothetical protein
LKDKIESKIQHIFKRITVLLKAKRQPDLHRGKSTDTTISADSVSLSNNEEDNNVENEEQYKSEDDDYDQIENIVHEDYSGLRKLYYVIFKDGGYGWLDENQISDILLSNWNNKK